ncbi:MAG: Holliday junction branch migration protein RuvA, partial [Lachnospiraceae bacterium]|nr:Holliday junction branch migration protein RuvA [Lachnospiraceae bacterium]
MISYIRGDVLFRNEQSVVIDVNGIGYEVFVPYGVLCAMERAQGSQV